MSSTLTPGSTVDGRYHVNELVALPGCRHSFRGTATDRGTPVVIMPVAPLELESLERLKGVQHAHLARVTDLVKLDTGEVALIGEEVSGETLRDRVTAKGCGVSVDAVRLILRLADAVSHAHAAGAYYGGIGPESVIAEPEGREGPVLAFTGWSKRASLESAGEGDAQTTSGAAGSGDLPNQAPTEAMDAWALGALLFFVITGSEPSPSGYESIEEVERAQVHDPLLVDALLATLHRDPGKRATTLKPLKRELARWFVDHAGDQSVPGVRSSMPPPLPSAAGPMVMSHPVPDGGRPTRSRASLPPAPRTPKAKAAWFLGALLVPIGSAWALHTLFAPEPEASKAAEGPAAAEAEAPMDEPKEKAIDLSEVSVAGDDQALAASRTASCVAGYLPKGSFVEAPDLEWLCTEHDPRRGGDRLRSAVVLGAGKQPSPAMRLFGRLAWYDMAAFATVHVGCCPERKPFELPKASEQCGDMGKLLSELGRVAVSSGDLDAAIQAYSSAIQCEVAVGRSKEFKRPSKVDGGELSAFRELFRGVVNAE